MKIEFNFFEKGIKLNTEDFKDMIRNFLKNEFKEIKENKIRFIALVFFTIIAVGFMFADDGGEQIELNEPVQIEQEQIVEIGDVEIGDKPTDSNKKIIFVKKNIAEDEEKSVTAVIGENQDDYVYIRDPFASEEKIEVAEKIDISNVEEKTVTTSKIPENSIITDITADNLPPIPEPDLTFLIPQNKPIIPENKAPADEFILEGTVICGSNKNALIKKISPIQNNRYREEDIIVNVGDYIQGQQITDIAHGKIILNNGENYMYLSGFELSSIEDEILDNEISSADLNDYSNLSDVPFENSNLDDWPDLNIDNNIEYIPDDFENTNIVKNTSEELFANLDNEENKIIPKKSEISFTEDSFIDEEIIEDDFSSVEIEAEKNSYIVEKIVENTDTVGNSADLSIENVILTSDGDTNFDDLPSNLKISPPSQE